MKRDLTPSRFIFLIFILGIIFITFISYYGGYFKDKITEATCNKRREKYVSGESSGEGDCIIPAGQFD